MNFSDFKIALRNQEENEKCCRPAENGRQRNVREDEI
jgi:hypothetical protein